MGGEWTSSKLSNLASLIKRGIAPKYIEEGGLLVLNQRCIRDQKLSISVARRHSLIQKKILVDKILKEGDVLINSTGVGTLGRVAQFKSINEDVTVDSHVTIVRLGDNAINLSFFGHLLRFKEPVFESLGEGSTGQTELSPNRIGDVVVNYPQSKSEQKAIAHILGSLDDKIELNRQTNQTLEAMAQALFKSWFVDFDPVIDNALAAGNEIPDALQDRANARKALGDKRKALPEDVRGLFPSSFVHSEELGWIPEGWEVGSIKNLCEKVESGGTPSRKNSAYWEDGAIPWLTSGEVNQDIIIKTKNFITFVGLENSSAKIWPKMSTIVAMYGATAGKITLLACKTSANQACCALIPNNNSKAFVYYKAKDSVSKYESRARGSAQQNLNKSIVSDLESLIPSNKILDSFEKKAMKILDKLIANKIMNLHLEDLRDTLLPKLISGELRIPEAEKLVEALK